MVHIVTDSTADVPDDVARELDITVVPAHILFGTQSYEDGITLSREEFYRRLADSAELPTTSAPSAGEFAEVYQRLGGEIVSIHLAAKLSAIMSAANGGAQLAANARVTLFDTNQVTMGIGWPVIFAARAARQGQPVDQIVQLLERIRPRVRVLAALDTFDYMRGSGSVGWAKAMLGQLLHIKPIVEVRDGEVLSVDRVRTRNKCRERLKQMVLELGRLQALAVLHTRALDAARTMADELAALMPDLREPVLVSEATTTIGTHVGPNGIGVAAVVAEQT